MARIYRIDVPTLLPSGEVAIWSHWIKEPSDILGLSGAVGAADHFMDSLAGNADFLAFFSATLHFGPCKISEVTEGTGVIVATGEGTSSFDGGSIIGPLPPQCSAVVSLLTPLAGASHRGRYYLPSPVSDAILASGRFQGGNLDDVLAALVLAHTDEMADSLATEVVVYSRTLHSSTPVERLRIGDVVDTQRRRRDKLVETYHTASL